MTREEALNALAQMTSEEQLQWMHHLGANLTVSARCFYATEDKDGSIQGLMGINEIQHRVYARIRDLEHGHEWTNESFLDLILKTASLHGAAGDVGWALKNSLMPFIQTLSKPN